MQGEKPTTSLVNPFSNKVSGIILLKLLNVLKRIMPLSIGHCTTVEPDIYQICFAIHFLSGIGNENDIVYVRAMQVKVFFRSIDMLKMRCVHEACLNGLLN